MVLYDLDGLVFITRPHISLNSMSCDVEYIRNKPYYVSNGCLYWVDEDILYILQFGEKRVIMQNDNLIGVREIILVISGFVVITHNYTIGVFDSCASTFEEFGNPNPNLELAKIYNYHIIKPDQVYVFNEHIYDFSNYRGQNMIVCGSKYEHSKERYKPYNEYIMVHYSVKNMIDRNNKFILYKEKDKLIIKKYDIDILNHEIPEGSKLYNPKFIETKSARSV